MKIAIIGCGTMGKGMAQRLSSSHTIFLYDRNIEKTEKIEQEGHGVACLEFSESVQTADVVILAIKPSGLDEISNLMSRSSVPSQMLISLLTGTPIVRIEEKFPRHRVVRMMPNLALLCGEAIVGLAVDQSLTVKESEMLTEICEPLGKSYWLDERKINAFTAIAGSGPAFVLIMMESMIDAAIGMGFNAKDAQELVHQMMKGTLELLHQSKKHPGELKWQISSPAGTTIAGVKKLEEKAVRSGVIDTFLATYDRANEMTI